MNRSLLSLLGRCYRLLQHELRHELAAFGIGLGEFRVVGLLIDEPEGLSQAQLCERLGVAAPTLSVAVRALEQRRVVVRHVHETDRRIKRVVLRSDADLEPVLAMLQRLESELGIGVSKRDLATTARVLSRVGAALQERAAGRTL